jgi:hypothetical protein
MFRLESFERTTKRREKKGRRAFHFFRMSACKRGRAEAASPLLSNSKRADLTTALENVPARFVAAAARLGLGDNASVDTVICEVGKALAASIQDVREAAERSSQQLEHARGVLHIAIDCRFDELLAGLSDAASRKVAALERELEQLDEVLESTRREHADAREAASSLDDAQLEAEFPSLMSRLGAAADVLAALPLAPVEIAVLHVDLDYSALLSEIAHAGVLVAPRGVSAAQLVLRGLPGSVRPGRPHVL